MSRQIAESFRIFMLLMHKNYLIRKRYWYRSILCQVFIPILFVLLGQAIKLFSNSKAEFISHNTTYGFENETTIHLLKIPSNLTFKYTPSNSITDEIMNKAKICLGLDDRYEISTSQDETTMINEYYRDNAKSDKPFIGIVFESVSNDNKTLSKLFKYKLRINTQPPMNLFDPEENGNGARHEFHQAKTVRVPLCLDKSFIQLLKQTPEYNTSISIQQMPYPPYTSVPAIVGTSATTSLLLTKASLWLILLFEIAYPANEKFIGINILMSVNGGSNRLNLLSWFAFAAIWSTSYLLPIVVILKHFLPPTIWPFLLYGNAFLVWLPLFFHVCHLIAFGLHISSYFWNPKYGTMVIFILIGLMEYLGADMEGSTAQRILLYMGIFSPNLIFKRIFSEIIANENKLIGVQWSNLFSSASDSIPEGSIGVMIIFSIIGILLHLSMLIYVYSIRPGKYGVCKHPLYCFQKRKNNKMDDDEEIIDFDLVKPKKKEFEDVRSGNLEAGISIRNLKKVYTTDWFRQTKVDALRNVSMDIYKNQITALLGHNGAGKTTIMSILSGLTDSTEGVVFIDGKNISNHTNDVEKSIGLCPQENMVFSDLTVHQHLMFFGMLRTHNRTRKEMANDVDRLLGKVNLTDKKNAYPAQLSGGQKRRLCLAMAIVGDAKVLILDEPTSGMDAESKREVWDILLKMRGEKTIIISTHDMEEADVLGDRIAIMHTGTLRSYGTSMFLKKLYGDDQVEVTLSIETWCDVSKIIEEIGINANILNQDDGKIILAIPSSQSLPNALDNMENSKKQLGITGISVSIITLEQVFLRVTKDDCDEQDFHQDIQVFHKVTGVMYYLQTFSAFFLKKITYTRKNPLTFWISMILPCISLILLSIQFDKRVDMNDPYPLTLDAYSNVEAFVHSNNESLFANMYINTIESYGGNATKINSNIIDGLLNYAKNNISSYRNKVIVSAEFNKTDNGQVIANGLYSGTATLGIPITINCITNTILKALTNDDEYKIEMSAQTLPVIHESNNEAYTIAAVISISFNILLPFAIAYYVSQPLSEISSGFKQLQLMTGAPKSMYWAAQFVFDFVQYLVSILLFLVLCIIADILLGTQLYHTTEIITMLTLLILFGLSVLPLVYLTTFLKLTSNTTITILSSVPILLAILDSLLSRVLLNANHKMNRVFGKILNTVFSLLPYHRLKLAYSSFSSILYENAHCRKMSNALLETARLRNDKCFDMQCHDNVCALPASYFQPELKTSMLWLGLLSIFYFGIIFILEQQYIVKLIRKIRERRTISQSIEIDEMVKEEKLIVNEEITKRMKGIYTKHQDNVNILLVQNLRKNYGNLHAVKGINFRVKESECFGLLGVNGAGKSTTFKMLTGEIIPNSGTVYLKQYNLSSNRTNYLSEMGYCPQQDTIVDTLNTWDHLYLFARLRGIPRSLVPSIVKHWVTKLNLTPCAFQPSTTYSGGNKRRLNIAMALIGNPPLVLMDEPTTGVDPAARRSLWNALKQCQNAGQSIILTSHSMEECEMLCNRLVIMVRGEIVCVGASQQLKQRFGAGYNIHIKLASTQQQSNIDEIKQRIVSKLNCNLVDEHIGFLGYHIVDPEVTWTVMYSLMDELKSEYDCIEDYVVLSSTLEQLFIQFARSTDNFNSNYTDPNEAATITQSELRQRRNGASPV